MGELIPLIRVHRKGFTLCQNQQSEDSPAYEYTQQHSAKDISGIVYSKVNTGKSDHASPWKDEYCIAPGPEKKCWKSCKRKGIGSMRWNKAVQSSCIVKKMGQRRYGGIVWRTQPHDRMLQKAWNLIGQQNNQYQRDNNRNWLPAVFPDHEVEDNPIKQ